jgi:hypothetical protein
MEHLRKLFVYLKSKAGEDVKFPKAAESNFVHIEESLLPHLLRVVQKDNTLFTGASAVQIIPGIDISTLWDGSDEAWSAVHMALMYSVLHGDPKEKFGKIMETVKGLIPGMGDRADEFSKIFEDEETQSSLKDILDLVMSTRIASLVGEVIQSLKFDDLGINFENPDDLMAMLQNPGEHPVVKEIMERAQMILEDKIKSGKINQQTLARDIEMIRAKFQSAFGKYINEMMTGGPGNTTGNTGATIMSHSPEARRARMIARLQKKLREKSRK